jgi:FkbM family methyltransferase
MLISIKKVFCLVIGTRTAYRLGRSIYMHARGDIPNDINRNGELLVQKSVIAAIAKSPDNDGFAIFDVGANVGDWTNSFLLGLKDKALTKRVDIYSFEPVPATANRLRNNLPMDNPFVHVEEFALSKNKEVVDIYVTGKNCATSSLYDDGRPTFKEVVQIQSISATEFCNERKIPHVHLLKCDTEGHDMEVIRGANQLLNEQRISVLQFEYNHRWAFSHNFLRDVFLSVESKPYTLGKLQKNYLLIYTKWHQELDTFFEGNYVLIHDDCLSWFPTKKANFDASNAQYIS